MAAKTVIHDLMKPYAFLLGTWMGTGEGFYPTISNFLYKEEITFTNNPLGKPVFSYTQKTWNLANGQPMHSEMGYLRAHPTGQGCDFSIVQVTGITEIEQGRLLDAQTLDLKSTHMGRGESGKHPYATGVERTFKLNDDGSLSYTLRMSTENTPQMTDHMKAIFQKKQETK